MDKYDNKKIAIIGAGHMGKAIIKGLLSTKKIKKTNILISNKKNNISLVNKADYIFIAVKPFSTREVLNEIKPFSENKIILSVVAGVDIKVLEDILGGKQKIIRLMPNILVGQNEGIIGFFPNKNISTSELDGIVDLLSILGTLITVRKDEDIDFVTLLVGCGPAISAYFINLLSNYGAKHGFSRIQSSTLALKLFKGTINYLEHSNITEEQLIESVATKGGVTEAILSSLNTDNLDLTFQKAIEKGYDKIKDLKNKV